jgi:hypothetical protein
MVHRPLQLLHSAQLQHAMYEGDRQTSHEDYVQIDETDSSNIAPLVANISGQPVTARRR